MSSTYSERLQLALMHAKDKLGLDQQTVARLVPMGQSTLSGLASKGKGGSRYNARIAEITGVSVHWLLTGDGAMLQTATSSEANLGRVPLFSDVEVRMYGRLFRDMAPDQMMEYAVGSKWTTVPHKERAFALIHKGDSMEPEFKEGMTLIVEPADDGPPDDGRFVVAAAGDKGVVVRKLILDGADLYLKPMNPQYPIRPLGSTEIIGTIIEAYFSKSYV